MPDEHQLAYLHRIDNVLFSHGGLADDFVRKTVPPKLYNDADAVISTINSFGPYVMWHNLSPLWYRPQYDRERPYKPNKYLQVVGHTPVKKIEKGGNVFFCDVFSTYTNGIPIGTQEYLLLDTETWQYRGI